ncbi:MAG: hypothetical protein HY335_00800 [Deinococcus sp.]|nr:hypothetical protein [Deinococcus sp.]
MGSRFGAGVAAGLVVTLVMTILPYLAPLMGLPKMDIPGMLGTMFASPGTGATGGHLGTHRGMMPAPGFFMANLGGMAAIGALIGHLVYGAVLGALYTGWAPAAQRTAPA